MASANFEISHPRQVYFIAVWPIFASLIVMLEGKTGAYFKLKPPRHKEWGSPLLCSAAEVR